MSGKRRAKIIVRMNPDEENEARFDVVMEEGTLRDFSFEGQEITVVLDWIQTEE